MIDEKAGAAAHVSCATPPGKQAIRTSGQLELTSRCVRRVSQVEQEFRKLRRLTDEKTIGDEAVDSAYCVDLSWRRWANHGALGEIWADELARHREDQVGLKQRIS